MTRGDDKYVICSDFTAGHSYALNRDCVKLERWFPLKPLFYISVCEPGTELSGSHAPSCNYCSKGTVFILREILMVFIMSVSCIIYILGRFQVL